MAIKRKTFIYALFGATLAMVVPVVIGLVLTWVTGRGAEIDYLNGLASDIGRRSAETRGEVTQALSEVNARSPVVASDASPAAAAAAACSGAELQRMREIAASKPLIKGLGYMQDGVLFCATMVGIAQPMPLGKPKRIDSTAMQSWSGVALPLIPGTTFNINARGNYAVFIPPRMVIDIVPETSPVSFAQISYPTESVVRSRGFFAPEWAKRFRKDDLHFVDQGYLVVAKQMLKPSDVIFAAMPIQWWWPFVTGSAEAMIPLSLLIGALLATLSWIAIRRHFSLSTQIKLALKKREFYLLYQPVMDLQTGRCVGAEALIRWKRSDGQPIGPYEFIPVAEASGLIVDVTARVIELVTEDAAMLIRNHPDTHIAINFSADDLHSPETENKLRGMLDTMQALPSNIVIEATERGFMSPDKATDILLSIRARGFKVAIDDFGTGNSSLSYLATYKLDFLKIDKMFVDAIATTTPTRQVAMHIIEMARTLNLQMIAEGVETLEQRDILRAAGVQFAQGWVFGKPMTMKALSDFVAAHPGVPAEEAVHGEATVS
jgi:sensor c-di-GMP phosphodiesterase-like protein